MAERPALILEFDGVVADTFDSVSLTLIESCQQLNISLGSGDDDVLALAAGDLYDGLVRLGADAAAVAEVRRRVERVLLNTLPWLKPVPLMADIIADLAETRRIVILSRHGQAVGDAFVRRHLKGVDAVMPAGDDAQRRTALAAASATEGAWYAAATVGDVKAATATGIAICAVAWSWQPLEELLAAGAEAQAETPAQLLEVVAPESGDDFWG